MPNEIHRPLGSGLFAPAQVGITVDESIFEVSQGVDFVSEDLAPVPGEWLANEPAGWTTDFDANMNYPGITDLADPFFEIDNSPLSGQWPVVQTELFDIAAIRLREVSGGPVSSPHIVEFFFPAGLGDGQRSAMMDGPLSDTNIGIYYAYTMKLSSNWSQGGVGTVNGVKHVEVRTSGGVLCRTNIGREVNSGTKQYGIRFSHVGVGHINRISAITTRFAPNEWVTVEALILFNSGGANTGEMRLWLNGALAGRALNKDIPKPGTVAVLRNLNVFGGGINDVPNDQFIDIGHFYASTG